MKIDKLLEDVYEEVERLKKLTNTQNLRLQYFERGLDGAVTTYLDEHGISQDKVADLNRRLENQKNTIDDFYVKNNDLKDKVAYHKDILVKTIEEVNVALSAKYAAEGKLGQEVSKNKKLEFEIEELHGQLAEQGKRLHKQAEDALAYQRREVAFIREAEQLEKRIAELTSIVTPTEKELRSLLNTRDEQVAELSALTACMSNEINEASLLRNKLQNEVSNYEKRVRLLTTSRDAWREDAQGWHDDCQKLQGQVADLKAEVISLERITLMLDNEPAITDLPMYVGLMKKWIKNMGMEDDGNEKVPAK